jgi:hypothetical protein
MATKVMQRCKACDGAGEIDADGGRDAARAGAAPPRSGTRGI